MLRSRLVVLALTVILFPSLYAQTPQPDGFTGTDLIVPAAGRVQGATSTFTTSVWVTNPNDSAVTFQMQFLQTGRSNPNPATATETIQPRETKVYENAAQALFGVTGVLGAIRV